MDNNNTNSENQADPRYLDLVEAIESFRFKNLRFIMALELYGDISQYSVLAPLAEVPASVYTAITTNHTGGFDGKLE